MYFDVTGFLGRYSCHVWHAAEIKWIHTQYFSSQRSDNLSENSILLTKLFWPTVRKNCSSDREKLLKFEAEGWEFAKCLRSVEQFSHI